MLKFRVPKQALEVTQVLQKANFEAFLVGGCVRDLLLGRTPKDWDIATNAKPEEIIPLFPKTIHENNFGTVTVINENEEELSLRHIQITPYRSEAEYSDKRHPDKVVFGNSLLEDLKRRDFTINALAYSTSRNEIVDPHDGQKDLQNKIIRTVGSSNERFREDALRMLRAVRLAVELNFEIERETEKSIKDNAKLIKQISMERVRDEFSRVIVSPSPMRGLEILEKTALLQFIVPELREGIGMEQNGDHIYDVWEHTLRVVQHAADKNYSFHVRLASLFHDIGKSRTRAWSKKKNDWTFYGHDVVGARMTEKILKRLRYPSKTVEIVTKLVKNHMFFSDIDRISLSAVRRIINKISPENVWQLMEVRNCDRIGMGRPKETTYRLRKYHSMIEEAMRAPTSVAMLNIDGNLIMEVTHEKSGPKIGFILHTLLEEVLDNPNLNTREYLEDKAIELAKLPWERLKILGEKGMEKKDRVEKEEIEKIRQRFHVK